MSTEMLYPHFQSMRRVGLHTAHCLSRLHDVILPGVTASQVNDFVKEYADYNKLGLPQFGFKGNLSEVGFPGHCCVSINDEICHGVPTPDKVFQDGDVVKVDVTFTDADNWHGDSCHTYVVGNAYEDLVAVAWMAMTQGIRAVKVGQPISDIGKAIEIYVKSNGYSVVTDFCGHSIGQEFHMLPRIPNYHDTDSPDGNVIMKPGMMFTIEPMINEGSEEYIINENQWTVVTEDGGWSAQFEHTIGIDEDGKVIIFTLN